MEQCLACRDESTENGNQNLQLPTTLQSFIMTFWSPTFSCFQRKEHVMPPTKHQTADRHSYPLTGTTKYLAANYPNISLRSRDQKY